MTVSKVFVLAAVIVFTLAALSVSVTSLSLVPLGLALLSASFLV